MFGQGEETLIYFRGIHGNEPASVTLCLALCDYLEQNQINQRVVVAVTMNPDGLAEEKIA